MTSNGEEHVKYSCEEYFPFCSSKCSAVKPAELIWNQGGKDFLKTICVLVLVDYTWLEERTFIPSRNHSHIQKQIWILQPSFMWCHFCHIEDLRLPSMEWECSSYPLLCLRRFFDLYLCSEEIKGFESIRVRTPFNWLKCQTDRGNICLSRPADSSSCILCKNQWSLYHL